MISQEQITYIMNELGLDAADASARTTIEKIVAAKPNTAVDAQFIASLRQELQTKANSFSSQDNTKKTNNFLSLFMNKILASALVVCLVLVAGGLWYAQQTDKPLFSIGNTGNESAEQILSGKYGVSDLEQESFGDLSKVAIVANAQGDSNRNTTALALNGAAMGAGQAETMHVNDDQKLIAPGEPYPAGVSYEFDYKGEDITNLSAVQNVYKRMKPVQPESLVSRIVGMLSFGLIDLNRFQNVQLQNFSFVEDRDFGYGLGVDLVSGSASVYQNWEKWPQPQPIEGQPVPLTIDQLPKNEEAIAIANDFLASYSISLDGYGAPQIMEQWRGAYERATATDRLSIYLPEQVQVVYPLVLDGKQVYDEGGSLSGLNVFIDARTKRVVSVYDLSTKQYERSEYVGVTDARQILKVAENGGFRSYNYEDPNAKKVTLELGTPTTQMVRVWYSTDGYKTNNEVFVSALVFPITNSEKEGYWKKNVIVPLVKDILESDDQQVRPLPIDIMQTEPSTGSSGSGSAGSDTSTIQPAPAFSIPEQR